MVSQENGCPLNCQRQCEAVQYWSGCKAIVPVTAMLFFCGSPTIRQTLCDKDTPLSKIVIRVLLVADWKTYKSLRLSALKDSPQAFASTFEREVKLHDYEWAEKLDKEQRNVTAIPLVAEINGTPMGLAWGVVHERDAMAAYVYQMWVNPVGRKNGLGRELLKAIVSWAQKLQLSYIKLAVTPTNAEAVSLYSSFGFMPIEQSEVNALNSSQCMQSMALRL